MTWVTREIRNGKLYARVQTPAPNGLCVYGESWSGPHLHWIPLDPESTQVHVVDRQVLDPRETA